MSKPIRAKLVISQRRSSLLPFTIAALCSCFYFATASPALQIATQSTQGTQVPSPQSQPDQKQPDPAQPSQTQPSPTQPSPTQPTQTQPKQPDSSTSPSTAASSPSAALQPSLDILNQTINGLRIEKWKGGSVRAEAGTNIGSIQRDLKGPLPALLADADADPDSVSKLLLVSRNVYALYDVLLRVYDASRVVAPGEQISQLEQAMSGVDKARRNLDDTIRDLVLAKEKQVTTLQASLKSQPAPVCPAPAPPPPATPAAKKKVVKKKPKPPASTAPANSQPNPQSGSQTKPSSN